MKFEDIVILISEEFTLAWNNWDVEKLIKLLAEDVTIFSPQISNIYPENTLNTLKGKIAIEAYWTLLKKKNAFLVKQISIKKVDREIKTVNIMIEGNLIIKETFRLNEYGKIDYLKYEYETQSL